METNRWVLSLSFAALGLSACGNTNDPVAPANNASAAVTPAAPSAPRAEGSVKERAGRGPLGMLQRALASVDLTAEQQAQVKQLATEARARHATMRRLRGELLSAVAAQVEDGRVNRVALQPQIDALKTAWQAAAPSDRAAVEQLHTLLTPTQRGKLVDTITAGFKDRGWGGRHHGGRGPMRHLQASGPQVPRATTHVLGDLGLTSEQRQVVRGALQARWAKHVGAAGPEHGGGFGPLAEMKARGAKLLQAFRGETFKMDELTSHGPLHEIGRRGGDAIIGMAETLLPLLTPSQRAALATKIRSRADHQPTAPDAPDAPDAE